MFSISIGIRSGNLEVKVDSQPIGGYRGKVGTLNIAHKNGKLFTEWEKEDLRDLALLIRKTLKIHSENNVNNTLIFGKQQDRQFKLSLVPYPKCNWWEKIRGIIDVIFGGSCLSKEQNNEISKFYHTAFSKKYYFDDQTSRKKKICTKNQDPFCKDDVINKQKIVDLTFQDQDEENEDEEETTYRYHLLHDNCPKGATKEDPLSKTCSKLFKTDQYE